MVDKRTLGKNGPQVSVIGLGCNNFGGRLDLDGTRKVVDKALELGINFFDTADIYGGRGYNNYGGSEADLGTALGARRKDIMLATKFGMEMHGAGSGASRALRHVGLRSEPQAPEDRLHRSLSDPPARPADADRRDVARARRSREAGQGPPHRLLEFLGGADR